jgi:tetratricopeptide (TPR) repeat protein
MVWYYLAHYSVQRGKHDDASQYYRLAGQARPDFCFPFRLESIGVLRRAMEANPKDARAPYYLGNLLYDLQPEVAIRAWERARKLDDSFAMVHRNLGLAYYRVEQEPTKALAAMETAFSLQADNPRFLYELDMIAEAADVTPGKRLQRFEENQAVVLCRDDTVARQVRLQILLGYHDEALDILTTRHFHAAEGGGEIRDLYVDVRLSRGAQLLRQGQHRESLSEFQAAQAAYPPNLEIAEPYRDPRRAEIAYHTGLAQEALGDSADARQSFERAAAAEPEAPEALYFQALALRKLGRGEQADSLCEELIRAGKELETNDGVDYFAKFGDRKSGVQRLERARRLRSLGLHARRQPEDSSADVASRP